MADVELDIPARAEFIAIARQVVAAAASVEPTFRHDRIEDLRVAVSEATTNAMQAVARVGSHERILIRCNLADDRVEVEVIDEGTGFDPAQTTGPPDPEHPDRLDWDHGLGLPIMRELADETEIRSSAEGTAVRLVVYKSPPPRV